MDHRVDIQGMMKMRFSFFLHYLPGEADICCAGELHCVKRRRRRHRHSSDRRRRRKETRIFWAATHMKEANLRAGDRNSFLGGSEEFTGTAAERVYNILRTGKEGMETQIKRSGAPLGFEPETSLSISLSLYLSLFAYKY